MGVQSPLDSDPSDHPAAEVTGPVAADGASSSDVTLPAADPVASTVSVWPGPGGAGSSARRQMEPGREVGAVRLTREIGRGATGAVFLGHHRVLGRNVAVKFLVNVSPGDARSPDGLARHKRFFDEARAAAAVRHPNLTQIYHADVEDGVPYLVLEFVHGPTLRQLLDAAGPLEVPVAVAIVSDVCAAVGELHARGVIHRDIKPSNVLLDKDGRVFVTDFGLAVRRSHSPGGAGASSEIDFAGTPAYMAPEMFDGRVSARSDVYALGVTAFQLLASELPFTGGFHELRAAHHEGRLPSNKLHERGVPSDVVEVIERATHKQAMFRYKTPLDLARALKQAADCGEPELSRARKPLRDQVARWRAESGQDDPVTESPFIGSSDGRTLPAERSATGTGSGTGSGAGGDPGSSFHLYEQTISRIVSAKRERRLHTAADLAAAATTSASVPGAPVPPTLGYGGGAIEAGAAGNAQGPVLAVSVMAVVYGALLAIWVIGEVIGAISGKYPSVPTPPNHAGVSLWLVGVAIVSLVLSILAVVGGSGCSRLRPWARRLLVRYAAADLVFQFLVLLAALAWVAPVTVNALASQGGWAPADLGRLQTNVYVPWVVRWAVLSLFPAMAFVVMTRPHVKAAFAPLATAVLPVDPVEPAGE